MRKAYDSPVVRRRRVAKDPANRRLAELAFKKLLVDSHKCVERSKALVAGSRTLIDASRELRDAQKGKPRDERPKRR